MTTSHAETPPTLAGGKMAGYYHACAFFRNRDEAYRVLTPFIAEGMDRGEKGMHVTNPAFRHDHVNRLRSAGLDIETEEREGRLAVQTWDEAYLKGGRFDVEEMLELLERVIDENTRAGFPRTRFVGDMGWAVQKRPGVEDVLVYEARVNAVLARHRQPGICMYDLTAIDADTMLNVLRTHPLVVMRDALTVNPFFMPPDEYLRQMQSPS